MCAYNHPSSWAECVLLNVYIHITGNLDLVSNKAVFRMEFNPWVTPIGDQLQVGISHVMDYIRSETYR